MNLLKSSIRKASVLLQTFWSVSRSRVKQSTELSGWEGIFLLSPLCCALPRGLTWPLHLLIKTHLVTVGRLFLWVTVQLRSSVKCYWQEHKLVYQDPHCIHIWYIKEMQKRKRHIWAGKKHLKLGSNEWKRVLSKVTHKSSYFCPHTVPPTSIIILQTAELSNKANHGVTAEGRGACLFLRLFFVAAGPFGQVTAFLKPVEIRRAPFAKQRMPQVFVWSKRQIYFGHISTFL